MWGFYKKRLRATMDWGNTHASTGYTHACGCIVDHVFLSPTRDPKDVYHRDRTNRVVTVYPCLKHTGKFFRTKWG